MSYRSGHHFDYQQQHHHPHDHGRAPPRRPATHHAAAAPAKAGYGYTIVHAGKQVRFGPVVFWIVVGTVVVLGMWSAATATYFAFRDDVLTRLIGRQAEMQYAYEDRIADLRAKVDRTTSRHLLDQEPLDQVERRQIAALSSVEDGMESRVRRMRGVFSDLGLDMAQLEAATPRSGVGGPFVPLKLASDAGPFERQLNRINATRAQVERL